jgi:hypothetical protein
LPTIFIFAHKPFVPITEKGISKMVMPF